MTNLEKELRATEIAFARTMADRDLDRFASFLSEEAFFFGDGEPLRGRDAVLARWARYFEGEEAPFSWEPDTVAVIDSGGIGLTAGPVRGPDGSVIGGFQSVWRREGGTWRIVLDRATG